MIDPKTITIEDQSGTPRHYIISRIPYLAGAREICSQYIRTDAPKTGDYPENERLAEKMLGFVSVVLEDGNEQRLVTKELINNHVPDFVTGMKLEEAMVSHNLGFSLAGKLHDTQQELSSSLNLFLTKMLTQLQDASSPPEPAPSTNSEPSTP